MTFHVSLPRCVRTVFRLGAPISVSKLYDCAKRVRLAMPTGPNHQCPAWCSCTHADRVGGTGVLVHTHLSSPLSKTNSDARRSKCNVNLLDFCFIVCTWTNKTPYWWFPFFITIILHPTPLCSVESCRGSTAARYHSGKKANKRRNQINK